MSDPDPAVGAAPHEYRSQPLAALLDVFAIWGSDGFIGALSEWAGRDLDPTSVTAVTMLARNGPMRPSGLAGRLHVGASNVSKISAHLHALDLVEKIADPADARATLLRLTTDGEKYMRDLVEAGDTMMEAIIADWPDADRNTLARLLARFEQDAARFARSLVRTRDFADGGSGKSPHRK